MFTILIMLIVSALLGFGIRRISSIKRILPLTTSLTILLLLFFFGISIGSNQEVLYRLSTYGGIALVIALLGVAGSVLGALVFAHFSKKPNRRA